MAPYISDMSVLWLCLHLSIVVVFENLASNLPFMWVISMNIDWMDTSSSNTQEIHFKDVKIDIFEDTKVICKKLNQIFRLHKWKKIFVVYWIIVPLLTNSENPKIEPLPQFCQENIIWSNILKQFMKGKSPIQAV